MERCTFCNSIPFKKLCFFVWGGGGGGGGGGEQDISNINILSIILCTMDLFVSRKCAKTRSHLNI